MPVLKPFYMEKVKENKSTKSLENVKFFWSILYEKDELVKFKERGFKVDEIEFLTRYRIASFYNRKLEEEFRDDPEINLPCIYKKEYIECYVNNLNFEAKAKEYFHSLIYSKIVTTCGAGYLFDNGRIKITEEEREKATKLAFKGY